MSSIKEQRTRLFQEKLQELGDIGTKERSEDAAPFYDKPTTMEQAVRKTEKEENFKEEACYPLQFTDYEACYLCPQSSKGAKSGFTIRTEVLHTLRHVLSDLRAETTLSSYIELLLSAKLQNATISLSAMPINRRCGLLFGKVSPPFRLSFIGCPLKRENGRHEMWPNVFFKPLRALEYGEFY